MADPVENPDCDVPNCYRAQCLGWGKSVASAINRPEFISQLKMIPHGKQAISFINACGDKGMQFLQMSDQIFHAALIQSSSLYFIPTSSSPGPTYCTRVSY